MTILAEISSWNSITTNVLLVIHVLVCLLLCLVVLMQRPKQEGLGAAFGGGMTDQAFGARTTDVLQKGTVYLASLLFIITLILSILTNSKQKTITDEMEKSGAAAIEENAGAVADALKETEAKIDPEALVDALKNATEEGDDKQAEEADKVEEDKENAADTTEAAVAPKPAENTPAEGTETPE